MEIILPENEIQARIKQIGAEIRERYADARLSVIGVTVGGIVFLVDLIRTIDLSLRVGLIHAKSYQGTRPGELTVDDSTLPEGIVVDRDVLLVDDIFDTGVTLKRTTEHLLARGARSVATAVLLRREKNDDGRAVHPDFVAFDIPDRFVVGYGLDYNDRYRNLPFIGILPPEAYETETKTPEPGA